ncbi:glycosyltransferase family 2 protein [Rudaea sp.]|uniref:glycosyltransferase family 2 protein n=1 Tax=Rudaea sp. TaxID=2136325 RepID=UPI002ED44486
MRLIAVVINFNTAAYTWSCVTSLREEPEITRILVLDNGSSTNDLAELTRLLTDEPRAELIRLESNLGFAEGSNAGIRAALASRDCDGVLFLNSDAQLVSGSLASMLDLFSADPDIGLVGGRMIKPSGAIDSLGIAFYVSCLASNRMTTGDRFFGPTGGCAIYRRELLEALQAEHGHMFDSAFFCYAEDTDVAARALLLGYRPAYFDGVVARHEGQVSSGGGFSDFVLYHGIRNSVWVLIKCVPWPVLLLCSPLIAALHIAIAVRHSLRGKARVVFRLYRDAFRGMPVMLRKRRMIQSRKAIRSSAFVRYMTPRFYDADYISGAIRELFSRSSLSR